MLRISVEEEVSYDLLQKHKKEEEEERTKEWLEYKCE